MKINTSNSPVAFNNGTGIFHKERSFDAYKTGYAVGSASSKEDCGEMAENFIKNGAGLFLDDYTSKKYDDFLEQYSFNVHIFKNNTLKTDYEYDYLICLRPDVVKRDFNEFMREKYSYKYKIDSRY